MIATLRPRWVSSLITLCIGLCLTPVASAQEDGAEAPAVADPQETPAPVIETYVPADLTPTLELFRSGDRSLTMGASMQVFAIPYIREDALVSNGDAGNEEGFRLRRTRIGLSGTLMENVSFDLVLNPLNKDDLIHNAHLNWSLHSAARFSIGSVKVPYSRSAVESSGRLHFADRPLGTGDLALGHRLGVTMEGRLWDGAFGYVAGVYNATNDFSTGNESSGLLYGGRIESAPLGAIAELCPDSFRFQIGGDALYEDGPTVNTLAASADLHIEAPYVRLRGEALYDRREPEAIPELPPSLTGEVERFVFLGEMTGFVLKDQLEFAARYEWYDNNRATEDFGDQQIITGGINYYLDGHRLKIMANYIYRDELEGKEIANDAVVISFVGAL